MMDIPYYSKLTSNFHHFLMRNIHLLLFAFAHTHFQMLAGLFSVLTCRYHLLKFYLAFT